MEIYLDTGIPAVVGVKGARSSLTDGEFVLLDGDRGIVKRLLSSEVAK